MTISCITCSPRVLGEISADSEDQCIPSAIFSFLFAICGLITIFSNVVNLVALRIAKQCFSENTRISFQLIAVVDLLVGLFCCTFHTIRCMVVPITKLRSFSIVGVLGCSTISNQSVMILTCVSIDRYIAVTRPLRYHSILTKRRMALLLVVAMLIGTVNSLSSLIHKSETGVDDVKFASTIIAKRSIHILYFIPILVSVSITIVCNIAIVRIARRHRRAIRDAHISVARVPNDKSPDDQLNATMRKSRDIRTVLAVTGVFYLTWGADIFANIVSASTGIMLPCAVSDILMVLVISNSFLNVLLYLLIKPSFRQAVMQLFIRR
ncbi:probable G-protein coupled receptor 21 [Diadema antillarum]|uniref:probable G-protein coupled receptor 21 n=1 Tax=Diadema antillarum TaxID=105358 RepID=UPI003A8BFFDB